MLYSVAYDEGQRSKIDAEILQFKLMEIDCLRRSVFLESFEKLIYQIKLELNARTYQGAWGGGECQHPRDFSRDFKI